MQRRGVLFAGLLLVATALAAAADPSSSACSCTGDACQCQSVPHVPSEAASLQEQETLKQLKEVSSWWDEHMHGDQNTSCSCSGASCYCSHAGDGGGAPSQHVACLCTNSSQEACRCGHAQSAEQLRGAAAPTEEEETKLMGQAKAMSEFIAADPAKHICIHVCHYIHICHFFHCRLVRVCHGICHYR